MMNRITLILYTLFLSIFIIIPLLIIITLGFLNENNELTFANFNRLLEPSYLRIFSRSTKLAFIATIFCILIDTLQHGLYQYQKSTQNILIIMIILPMWINTLLRTYAWIRILGKNGIINNLLEAMGLANMDLIYNEQAVIIGMVYNFLPFMVLPIYTGLLKIKSEYIEGAKETLSKNVANFALYKDTINIILSCYRHNNGIYSLNYSIYYLRLIGWI